MGRLSQMVTVFTDNQMFWKLKVLFSVVRKWLIGMCKTTEIKSQGNQNSRCYHLSVEIVRFFFFCAHSWKVFFYGVGCLINYLNICLQSVQVLREKIVLNFFKRTSVQCLQVSFIDLHIDGLEDLLKFLGNWLHSVKALSRIYH